MAKLLFAREVRSRDSPTVSRQSANGLSRGSRKEVKDQRDQDDDCHCRVVKLQYDESHCTKAKYDDHDYRIDNF
jgi:hypothetical protein